jgi:hypothetical protein
LPATSTGAQRSRDRRLARRARSLPLRGVSLVATSLDVGGRRAALRVRTQYGLEGIRGRFVLERRLRAERAPGGWRVVRERPGRRGRAPWDVARFVAHRTRHFLVLAPAGLSTPGLDAALEAGRRRLATTLPTARPPDRLLVVVTSGAGQASALTSSIRGVEGLTAVSDAAVREDGPARRVIGVESQRMLVLWPALSALDAAGRVRVVAHELTHAGLATRTSGRTPAWLLEGLALYASGDDRRPEAALALAAPAAGSGDAAANREARDEGGRELRRLARPDAMARLSGLAQGDAYAYASAAAFTVAADHGERALLRLYDSFNDPRLRGRPGPALQRQAIRRVLGISPVQLAREIRRVSATRTPGA